MVVVTPVGFAGGVKRNASSDPRRARVVAALVLVVGVIAIATLGAALTTRGWVGLERVVRDYLIVGVAVAVGWAVVTAVGLLLGRQWAIWSAIVTFALVAVGSAAAVVDIASRVAAQSAPLRHLIAPGTLLVSSALVVAVAVSLRVEDRP